MSQWLSMARMARRPFLMVTFVFCGVAVLPSLADPGQQPLFRALLILQVPVLCGYIAFCVRRLHDVGYSGWYAALILVPVVNLLLMVFLVTKTGDEGANAWGPPPA